MRTTPTQTVCTTVLTAWLETAFPVAPNHLGLAMKPVNTVFPHQLEEEKRFTPKPSSKNSFSFGAAGSSGCDFSRAVAHRAAPPWHGCLLRGCAAHRVGRHGHDRGGDQRVLLGRHEQ